MTTEITIQTEWQRRINLIEDKNFRALCVDMAKKLGITSEEWNKNKAVLLMFFANQICSLENNMQ